MSIAIEKELTVLLAEQKQKAVELFLDLTKEHWVREARVENGKEAVDNRIILRSDHQLSEKLKAEAKEGFVFEDDVAMRSNKEGTTIIAPIENLNRKPGEQTLHALIPILIFKSIYLYIKLFECLRK